jgi:hypothetical protein
VRDFIRQYQAPLAAARKAPQRRTAAARRAPDRARTSAR